MIEIKEILDDYHILLDFLKIVGDKLLEIYNKREFELNKKNDKTRVTTADLLSNKLIIEFIEKKFPTHKIISEELNTNTLTNDLTFLIDPLDGTNDFINRTGEFSIMISVLEKKELIIGIVYFPIENKFIFAKKNKGCYSLKNHSLKKLEVNPNNEIKDFKSGISRNYFSDKEKELTLSLGIKKNNLFPMGSIGRKISKICEKENDFYVNFSGKLGIWEFGMLLQMI